MCRGVMCLIAGVLLAGPLLAGSGSLTRAVAAVDDDPATDPAAETGAQEAVEKRLRRPDLGYGRRPFVGVAYGTASMDRDGFEGEFATSGVLTFKLGFQRKSALTVKDPSDRRRRDLERRHDIFSYESDAVFLTGFSSDLASGTPAGDELESTMWSFGFGRGKGYGYALGTRGSFIVPYNSRSLAWSVFSSKENGEFRFAAPSDSVTVRLFDDELRFGSAWEAGLRLSPVRRFNVDAAYERLIAFPGHRFWAWILSQLIEEVAASAVDEFVEEIGKTSPGAMPVMSFLLNAGLNFGLYELRRDRMNWPLNSAAPLAVDSFRAGVSFSF